MRKALIVILLAGLVVGLGLQQSAIAGQPSVLDRALEHKEAQDIVDEYGKGVLGFNLFGGNHVFYAPFINRVLNDQNLQDVLIKKRNAGIKIYVAFFSNAGCYNDAEGDTIIHTGTSNKAIIAYLNDKKAC